MPENKPKFDPNKPFEPASQNKPAFDPNKEYTPVDDGLTAIGRLKSSSAGTIPKQVKSPLDIGAESAVELIKKQGGRNGSILLDSELDVLKDVLKDPRATDEQRKRSILVIQGYDPKHSDDGTMFYMSMDENGVVTPKALAYGEKAPKGYEVAKVWGNKQAEDDAWYTDLGKSIANGVMSAVGGVVDVAQIGTTLVTGEESKFLNKVSNTVEALKFEKDSDLDKQIYNFQGIEKFSDILDSKRVDLSPEALWGTFNGVAESLVGFAGGAKIAGNVAKGAKGLVQGLKGVDEAVTLSEMAKKSSMLAGSFAIQVGDIYETAKDAGLEGRDAAGFATVVGGLVSSLDVTHGLEGKIMSNLFEKSKKETFKNLIKGAARDKAGNITPEAMKGLLKDITVSYSELAKVGTKEIVKDVLKEGGQEAAQSFTQKAGEQLWDKLSDEDKAKFGTDAFDAKSFGEYISNFATGLVGGVPMALVSSNIKKKAEEQSVNAYAVVKQGPEAVKSLKAELASALKNNEINQDEYNTANFKIDKYQQYNELVNKYSMKPADEKRAFELTFQIDGLSTEIPTNKKEVENLNPIEKAEVSDKKKQRDALQKELEDILLRSQVKTEPVVADKIEEKVASEEEGMSPERDAELDAILSKYVSIPTEGVDLTQLEDKPQGKVRLKLDEVPNTVFNDLKPLVKKQIAQEYLKDKPNMAVEVDMYIEENGKHVVDFGGKKYVTLASSAESNMPSTKPSVIKRENLPNKVEGKYFLTETGIEENMPVNERGEANKPITSFDDKVIAKREEILAFNEDGSPDLDESGNQKKKAIINLYNRTSGGYIVSLKEFKKGDSVYTPKEVAQMQEFIKKGFTPVTGQEIDLQSKEVEDAAAAIDNDIKTAQLRVEKAKKDKATGYFTVKIDGNEIQAKTKNGLRNKVATYFYNKNRAEELKKEELSYETNQISLDENAINSLKEKGYTEAEINKAISEAQGIMNKSRVEIIQDMYDLGMFNALYSTDNSVDRLDTRGVDKNGVRAGLKNLRDGETKTEAAQVLLRIADSIKKNGEVPMIKGVSGATEAYNIPFHELFLDKPETKESPKGTDISIDKDTKDIVKGKFEEGEETPFQKKASKVGDAKAVAEKLQKSMPKVKVVYNSDLKVAGKWNPKTNTIEINPFNAGVDTPIHEYGHVLIEAMGYDNKIIQAAINQLKSTELYKQTKEAYPNLDERGLNMEVLAEAIGREGADIFDKESDKSKFRQYLEYIFDWFKRNLGLDKNIAKSLAKQIISGIGTEKIEAVKGEVAKEQKESKRKGMTVMPYNLYRKNIKLRNIQQEEKDLAKIQSLLDGDVISATDRKFLEQAKQAILKIQKGDSSAYKIYKADMNKINEINESSDLSSYSIEDLVEVYNKISNLDPSASDALMDSVKKRIAYSLWSQGKERLSKNEAFIEATAKNKDISSIDVKMKVLSHFTENNPEMQEFSKIFDKAEMAKTREVNAKQLENDKLARKVIEEKNKKLGIIGKAKNLFSSDTVKYFEYMDNGQGMLLTIEEAKQKGLSEAQINYLKFMRELIAERSQIEIDPEMQEMEVIKLDKGFQEAFKTSGLVEAFSYYIGGGRTNLSNVRIDYKGKPEAFGNIEKDILSKVNKGEMNRLKAMTEIAFYNYHARKQLKKGYNVDEKENPLDIKQSSQYSINPNGMLTSKFDKPRSKDRGYSKDFYRAANEFIAETAHVKHMSKIIPVINSLEYLAKNGFEEGGIAAKQNTAKWIDEWRKMKIFKEQDVNAPEVDVILAFLRKITSMSTMMFNFAGQRVNAIMGMYNNFRSENAKDIAKGLGRLYGKKKEGAKFDKDYVYGVFNPYALDIARKYNMADVDLNANVKPYIGNIFSELAHLGTKWGEANTQLSLGFGLMDDKIYNAFERVVDDKGVSQLVVKKDAGVTEAKIEEHINSIKNRVSDIQGKYSEKDRRNIENNELGRVVFQFKTWIPDWWKERFGAEYIDRDGVVRKGSWTLLTRKGIKDLKKIVNEKGIKKGLFDGKTPESKAFLANLKGAIVVGSLLAWKYSDDDDDKKKKASSMLENTIGQMLFIFDPDQLKYTLKNPVAVVGTVTRFIESLQKVSSFEEEDVEKGLKGIGKTVPGRKLVETAYEAISEE